MIISFINYLTLSKFVDSSFPQCNVHTDVQGGCLAFTHLDVYLKVCELHTITICSYRVNQIVHSQIDGLIVSHIFQPKGNAIDYWMNVTWTPSMTITHEEFAFYAIDSLG